MNTHNLLGFIILSIFIFSCGGNSGEKKKYFSIQTPDNQTKYKLDQTIKATITNTKNFKIDSIHYFLDTQKIATTTQTTFEEKIDTEKLGNHILKADIYFEGKSETATKKLVFLNNKPPKIYSYKIIATYPHDSKAYTQGLEFVGDTLYESTGKNGKSSLRKIDHQTGKVLIKKDIDKKYFAEGITILDNKIIQLTWQAKEGFIYNLNTFEKTGNFAYNKSKQGWGLCNDKTHIYKSDGTEKIWTLDPKTLAEQDYIEVATDKAVKSRFNELEWVDGKIYANTYQKDGIAIINPSNGALEAVINLKGLREKATPADKENNSDFVLNGIAYKPETKQLYVTGKYWDKLFEIEIIK